MNEEATDVLNQDETFGHTLPELLRLIHSQNAIDTLFATGWEHRTEQLIGFIEDEAWLWQHDSSGFLEHKRLLSWMKSPTPENLARYFRYWGVSDVFASVTRAPHTRSELWLRIEELVGKRNNIAHGDLSVEATQGDLEHYREATQTFCERADRLLARTIGKLVDRTTAW